MPLGPRQRIARSIANIPLVDRLARCFVQLPEVRIVPLAPLYQRQVTDDGTGALLWQGGPYADPCRCWIDDEGWLLRYEWQQPGVGLWDVRRVTGRG